MAELAARDGDVAVGEGPATGDERAGGAMGLTPAQLRAALDAARSELDRAWPRVLAAQAARDPDRAAAIRAALDAAPAVLPYGVGAGFSAARRAWPHLDDAARQEWLAAFRAIWRDTIANPALHRELARALRFGEPGAAA